MENNRFIFLINKYWFYIFGLSYGLFVGLPFLAPVLMEFELTWPAKVIYTVYSFLCHQLPQRSFFLFGEKLMYSLTEFHNPWQASDNPLVLRKFIGNTDMGWKVAWSDRMIFMYSSALFAAWIWFPLRRKLKSIPVWGLILFVLPMALDGITHTISDFAGIGQGFRDSNAWLASLTNDSLSPEFYAGDKLGSFNSWMRMISGTLFGTGIVLYGFPYLSEIFDNKVAIIKHDQIRLNQLREETLEKINVNQNWNEG
ncbi:MAG: hypothetical protein CVU41_17220 [Chloroflexi bacterium HGW-Chloroflexi-3]|nr:MAG: hypothetical protein CVU41_17220 [Chloroflexi bacterium HGW-Chloroflexi-3]